MDNPVERRVGFKTKSYRLISVTKESNTERPMDYMEIIRMKSSNKYWLVYLGVYGDFISKEINNDGGEFVVSKDIIREDSTWVMTIDDYGVLETNLKGVI